MSEKKLEELAAAIEKLTSSNQQFMADMTGIVAEMSRNVGNMTEVAHRLSENQREIVSIIKDTWTFQKELNQEIIEILKKLQTSLKNLEEYIERLHEDQNEIIN